VFINFQRTGGTSACVAEGTAAAEAMRTSTAIKQFSV